MSEGDKGSYFKKTGTIAWMAGHSVTANLLMLLFLVGGAIIGFQIKQEVFPEFDPDSIRISVSYPGSSPEEVEEGILLPVEQAIENVEGIKDIVSVAKEGSGQITVEVLDGEDPNQVAADIKTEVDSISTFPDEAEAPNVAVMVHRRNVLSLVVYGDHDERTIRDAGELIRDRLLQNDHITQVDFSGVRDYEVTVTVDSATLRQYGLTLRDVAQRIKLSALDMPAGGVQTRGGEVLVRMKERRNYAKDFEDLVIFNTTEGASVRLGDIAKIEDGFEDNDKFATYNGKRAIRLDVYRVGDQTPIDVSDATKSVVKELNETLPKGLFVEIRSDRSKIFKQRAQLLIRNAALGLILVLIVMGLFLESRLAFWVTMGIPISFMGCFFLMPLLGVTINMISMFAFIITLGIVVDDAIVVGENVYRHHQEGLPFWKAAVSGTREVAMPVVFSVITNIVAFMPLLFVPGRMGNFFYVIPIIVILVFSVSLIESLLILPAHLSQQHDIHPHGIRGKLHHMQQRFSHWFRQMVIQYYGSALEKIIEWRYVVVAVALFIMMLTIGYVKSNRIRMILIERPDSDYAYANAVLPYGVAIEDSSKVAEKMVTAVQKVAAENGGKNQMIGVYATVGNGGSHNVEIRAYLTEPDVRRVSTAEFTKKWRKEVGDIVGVESLTFQSDRGGPGSGKGITIELSHRNVDTLDKAGKALAEILKEYPGVKDVDDGFQPGKPQLDFFIRPEAQALGLTADDIATQVRDSFYGAEALRQLRGRNEVKTMVRLPKEERISEYDVDNLIIRTPSGGEMLLRDAVDIHWGRAFTVIERHNGRRVIQVSASTEKQEQVDSIVTDLKEKIMDDFVAQFPGLSWSFEGRQADMRESTSALMLGLMMALFGIYALLAIPFNNYYQPIIIMLTIPFGLVGSVIGHIIMGYQLSLLSLFGIVALSGVVVNDSLVFIDFANRRIRNEGKSTKQAIHDAGVARFRPIILTTLTTFMGLAPMILETSRQARFMIPMAISLGFGILFATLITLVLIPAVYLILEDIRYGLKSCFYQP